jgi:hypothetical protein
MRAVEIEIIQVLNGGVIEIDVDNGVVIGRAELIYR